MYFNFKYALSKSLSPYDILTLQTIKQMRFENLETILAGILEDSRLDFFVEQDYVTQIKGSKGDSEIARLRLTKKGMKLLDNIECVDVNEDSIIIFEWLKKIYSGEEDKFVGNGRRTKQGIAQFSAETGIVKNQLSFLIKTFLQSDSFEFSYKLENLFFSNKNLYSRKFDLEECRLYTFYLKKKDWFDRKFETL